MATQGHSFVQTYLVSDLQTNVPGFEGVPVLVVAHGCNSLAPGVTVYVDGVCWDGVTHLPMATNINPLAIFRKDANTLYVVVAALRGVAPATSWTVGVRS